MHLRITYDKAYILIIHTYIYINFQQHIMSEAVGPIDFKTIAITNLHPYNRSQALIQTVMSLQSCQLNVRLLKLEYTLQCLLI